MILRNGRRERIDMGPGSGLGQLGSVNVVNVVPGLEMDARPIVPPQPCAICTEPARAGRLTCGPVCARQYQGRWSMQ